MYLVAGLGNPGERYDGTRHNIGFVLVEAIATKGGVAPQWKLKGDAAFVKGSFAGQDVILVKPLSFMNRSGEPIAELLSYFKVPVGQLIVLHDEIDLPFGTIRVKKGGGEAGHNGLKSITAVTGTQDYWRVRFGVGRPPHPSFEVADWVLGRFLEEERVMTPGLVERALLMTEEVLLKNPPS